MHSKRSSRTWKNTLWAWYMHIQDASHETVQKRLKPLQYSIELAKPPICYNVMLRMIRICRNYWTLDTLPLWLFKVALIEWSSWSNNHIGLSEQAATNLNQFTEKYFENETIWDFRHEAWLWLNCNNREQREKVNSFSETVVFEITSLLRRWPPALLDKFSTKFHSLSDPVVIHP